MLALGGNYNALVACKIALSTKAMRLHCFQRIVTATETEAPKTTNNNAIVIIDTL